MSLVFCSSLVDCSSYTFHKLVSPFKEASLHMNIALSGKVDHLAQRIFADREELKKFQLKSVSISERVFHFLSAFALSIPLINLVFQNFIPSFPKEKKDDTNESLTIKPHPILMRDRNGSNPGDRRIGFGKIEIREFDKDFAPGDKKGYLQHSLKDLPDEKTMETKVPLRKPRRQRPECTVS